MVVEKERCVQHDDSDAALRAGRAPQPKEESAPRVALRLLQRNKRIVMMVRLKVLAIRENRSVVACFQWMAGSTLC
jgi:hypothetical protein